MPAVKSILTRRSVARSCRPVIEAIESRLLMTAVVVNSPLDVLHSGGSVISLRDAIATANASTTATTITFSPTAFATAQTITLVNGQFNLTNADAATTITGPAAGLIINGNGGNGGFSLDGGVTASMSNLTITKSSIGAFEDFGHLTLNNVIITQNTSDGAAGPAIDISGGATLTGTNLTISNNEDDNGGVGAISNSGTLVIKNSTFTGNKSSGDTGSINVRGDGTATLINDTFFNNQCGGVEFDFGGTGFLYNDTIVGNNIGVYVNDNDPANLCTIANTIVAGNTAPDTFGKFKSLGGNLIGDPNGGGLTSTGFISTDQLGTTAHPLAAKLGALANNGGPTQTLLPLTGSPAIDKGLSAKIPAGITTDQRGLARVFGTAVDVGAVEVQPPPAIAITAPAAQTGKLNTAVSVALGTFTQTSTVAPYSLDIAWGDGTADSIIKLTAAGAIPATTHAFAKSGPITVSETLTDANGVKSNKATFVETVPSSAVVKLTAPANQTAKGGVSTNVLLGSFTETGAVGTTAPYRLEVDFGDGGAHTIVSLPSTGTIPAITHVYGAGKFTVTESVQDIQGNKSNVVTFTETVSAAPFIKVTAPASQTAVLGTSTSVTLGSFTQTGATGPFKVDVKWGDGSADTILTVSAAGVIPATAHIFTKSGVLSASITVTDANLLKSPTVSFSETVSATAVALKITPPANQTAKQGTSANVALGSFTQTGATGQFKVDVNWGDGTADTILTVASAGAIPTTAHTFAKSGALTVSETVTDAKGHKSPTATFTDTVSAAVDPKTASISGKVFNDANADGKIDNGEIGVGLWTVYIDTNNNSKLDTSEKSTTTDINGNWSFKSLAAGTYTVRVVPVAGDSVTKPTGGVLTITLTIGQASIANLFGEKATA